MAGIDFILGKHKNIFRTISKILCSKIALSCLREQLVVIINICNSLYMFKKISGNLSIIILSAKSHFLI